MVKFLRFCRDVWLCSFWEQIKWHHDSKFHREIARGQLADKQFEDSLKLVEQRLVRLHEQLQETPDDTRIMATIEHYEGYLIESRLDILRSRDERNRLISQYNKDRETYGKEKS